MSRKAEQHVVGGSLGGARRPRRVMFKTLAQRKALVSHRKPLTIRGRVNRTGVSTAAKARAASRMSRSLRTYDVGTGRFSSTKGKVLASSAPVSRTRPYIVKHRRSPKSVACAEVGSRPVANRKSRKGRIVCRPDNRMNTWALATKKTFAAYPGLTLAQVNSAPYKQARQAIYLKLQGKAVPAEISGVLSRAGVRLPAAKRAAPKRAVRRSTRVASRR